MISKVIAGPCLVTWNNLTFFTTGDVTVASERQLTHMESSQHGRYDSRHLSSTLRISFTPVGQSYLVNALLSYAATKARGASVVPGGYSTTYAATGVNATDVVTVTGWTAVDGTALTIVSKTGGSGVSTGVVYYARDSSGSTCKLALTAGGSAENLGSDISAAVIGLVRELPLVIQPLSNHGDASRIWTFPRAGLTALGDMMASASRNQLGAVTFTALESQITPDTFFSTAAYAAPSSDDIGDFSPTEVYTSPCEAVWADVPGTLASGDFTATAMDGWTISPNFSVEEHWREECGLADILFKDCTPVVSGSAANFYDHTGALLSEHSAHALFPFQSMKPGQRANRKKLSLRALANASSGGASPADGDVLWEFPKVEVDLHTLNWGDGNRTGQVRFVATPTFDTGSRIPLITEDAQS